MSITNEKITNLEQAKRYFISMGCSHFHISREDFRRADEYRSLDIDRSIESEWIKEEFENKIENLYLIEPKNLDWYFSSLVHMIEQKEFYLEKLLNLTYSIIKLLKPDQLHRILSEIIGTNGTKTKGGLIQKSYDLKRKDLAKNFYEQSKLVLKLIEENSIQVGFIRGNLLDLIEFYRIEEDNEFLIKLRYKDNFENFEYYKEVAKEGNIGAMKMLSVCYQEGKGCDRDINKAKFWKQKANLYRAF